MTTTGNPLAHAILRGGVDKYGTNIPNYHFEDLTRLCALYAESGLQNPACIVDANHSNSGKKFREQVRRRSATTWCAASRSPTRASAGRTPKSCCA